MHGALLGNHLKIEMEDSPVDYNEETGEQAYENVAGEVYGGNYTVSRPPPPPSPSGSSSPPVIATCPSTMASSTNSRGPIIDNQVVITSSRFCKWRDGEKGSQISPFFHHALTGLTS